MKIEIKEIQMVEIDEQQALEITREVLRKKFNMQERRYIDENGDLAASGGDYRKRVIRKATDRDRLYFAVLEVLERNWP